MRSQPFAQAIQMMHDLIAGNPVQPYVSRGHGKGVFIGHGKRTVAQDKRAAAKGRNKA